MPPKKVSRQIIQEKSIDLQNDDDEDFFSRLFASILEQFKRQKFCDAVLYAQDDSNPSRMKSLKCHSLILVSVVPALKELLLESEEESHLIFPDLPYSQVQKFVKNIYTGLIQTSEFTLEMSQPIAAVFGMLDGSIYHVEKSIYKTPQITAVQAQAKQEFVAKSGEKEKMVEIVVENNEALGGMQQFELILPNDNDLIAPMLAETTSFVAPQHTIFQEQEEDVKSPMDKRTYKKSGRKRAMAGEAWGPVAKIMPPQKKSHYDTMNSGWNWILLPPNPNQSPKTLMEIRNNLCKQEGLIVANTNNYYTVPRVTNEKGLNLVTKDGTERQFRMKLPEESTITAFMAVGCRDGRNIATTLALKEGEGFVIDPSLTWSAEDTFYNLIEATKRIGGLSFGDILKHPRCAGSKEHFSKNAVNQVKDELTEISNDDRESRLNLAVAELKSFEEKLDQLSFHHLPAKKVKMGFHMVPDIEPHEILDYCIFHGSSVNDMIIQSFFNFGVQKFTRLRLVTTMCDTVACFLGLMNYSPLSEHPLMKEAYDKYSEYTVETIALQDLQTNQVGRSKCKDLIEVTDANYLPATEETVTDVVLVDGKILTTTPTVTKTIHIPPAKRGPKKGRNKAIPCPHCKKTFGKEILLQGHIERMHSSISESSKSSCTVCNKTLKGAQTLRDHIYYYHTPKMCNLCNAEFPGAYQYYYHRNHVHSNPLFCDLCGGEFKSKEKLRVHKINKHLEDHEKPYVCSICGKGYAHKTKLESHQMNVHIRSRPYKCRLESCDADFNELANRNAHERNVHQFDYKKYLADSASGIEGVKVIIDEKDEEA